MRQVHKAGDKLFVDYAGQTIPIVQNDTGEVRFAQIFVAVLGASNYTFAEATWNKADRTGWVVMSGPLILSVASRNLVVMILFRGTKSVLMCPCPLCGRRTT